MIVKSLAIGKAKGSAGNLTYTTIGDATIAKGKVAFPRNPKTYAQMERRVRLANLVNLYQAMRPYQRMAFQLAEGRVSDYNLFISRNINTTIVYLTDKQAMQGAAVACGVMVTEGELPVIGNSLSSGVLVSDIQLGTFAFDEGSTVGEFSNAVIAANGERFRNGDQISLIYLDQKINVTTTIPYVAIHVAEVTLNSQDESEIADFVDPDLFSKVDGYLGMGAALNGAAAFIHSRIGVDGATLVSTQRLIVANNILPTYQSSTARDNAIISYGGDLTAAFLTPNITDVQAPV